jgi:hypothetical protein
LRSPGFARAGRDLSGETRPMREAIGIDQPRQDE